MPYYFGDVISPHPLAEWQPMARYDTASYIILINQCNKTISLPEEEESNPKYFVGELNLSFRKLMFLPDFPSTTSVDII